MTCALSYIHLISAPCTYHRGKVCKCSIFGSMELLLSSYESNAGTLALTRVLDFALLITIQINLKVVDEMKTAKIVAQLAG